jgi:hypothetical protein
VFVLYFISVLVKLFLNGKQTEIVELLDLSL